MPNYNVEVFVHEEGETDVHKIVWVANYKDAATAIETAGRRAIGIANYMKRTNADLTNLGGVVVKKVELEKKVKTDVSKNLRNLREYS